MANFAGIIFPTAFDRIVLALRVQYIEQRHIERLIILVASLFHLGLALYLPLAAHEAHYASYGLHLDYGYVDHPPLVGWLQALSAHWLGGGDLALRLAPIVLTAMSLYMLAALTRELYPDDSPWLPTFVLLLLQVGLVMHLGLTMAPEIPFLTLSIGAMWLTARIVRQNAWIDWIGLGCVLGLAGMAKFSAIMVAVSVPLALIATGNARRLFQIRFYTAACLALLIVSPALIWNYQHDWISFVHQASYQLTSTPDWQWRRAVASQLQQWVAYSPLLYMAGVAGVVTARRNPSTATRLIIAFALPILLVFFIAGGYTRTRVHWTLVGWVLIAPLAAHWLLTHWRFRAVRITTIASGLLSVLALVIAVSLTSSIWRFSAYAHPYGELYGWEEATAKGVKILHALQRQKDHENVVFFTLDFHDASRLAWYARPLPVQVISNKTSQYPLWFGSPAPGDKGLLLIPQYKQGKFDLPPKEYHCRFIEKYQHHQGDTLTDSFRYYDCG
jgi:hypothetical protein